MDRLVRTFYESYFTCSILHNRLRLAKVQHTKPNSSFTRSPVTDRAIEMHLIITHHLHIISQYITARRQYII